MESTRIKEEAGKILVGILSPVSSPRPIYIPLQGKGF